MIDITYQKCFFDTRGITSTSANHLANIAKETMEETKKFLDKMSLYSTDVTYIGATTKSRIKNSITREEFNSIADKVQSMCEFNTFISWVREAIKEKDRMMDVIKFLDFNDFLRLKGIELVKPDRPDDTEQSEILARMDIGNRFQYLKAEACAATYGQVIHPTKPLNHKRSELATLVNVPIELSGEGRDAIIYTHNFDFSIDEVDKLFFNLQDTYRTYEKTLNSFKFNIKKLILQEDTKRRTEYEEKYNEYDSKRDTLYNEFKDWKDGQVAEISQLKVVIPDSLKSVYEKLEKIGKAK